MEDGSLLAEGEIVVLCIMIKSGSVYFNSQQVEQNPLFGHTAYMQLLTGMSTLMHILGRNMFIIFA